MTHCTRMVWNHNHSWCLRMMFHLTIVWIIHKSIHDAICWLLAAKLQYIAQSNTHANCRLLMQEASIWAARWAHQSQKSKQRDKQTNKRTRIGFNLAAWAETRSNGQTRLELSARSKSTLDLAKSERNCWNLPLRSPWLGNTCKFCTLAPRMHLFIANCKQNLQISTLSNASFYCNLQTMVTGACVSPSTILLEGASRAFKWSFWIICHKHFYA